MPETTLCYGTMEYDSHQQESCTARLEFTVDAGSFSGSFATAFGQEGESAPERDYRPLPISGRVEESSDGLLHLIVAAGAQAFGVVAGLTEIIVGAGRVEILLGSPPAKHEMRVVVPLVRSIDKGSRH